MSQRPLVCILVLILLLAGCAQQALETPTPSTTETPLASPMPSPTPTPTLTPQLAPAYTPIVMGTPPAQCPTAGAESYGDPLPEVSLSEIVLNRGTLITVTTNLDTIDGDISSVKTLLANPGQDGISLREAIEVTNSDPAIYTIEFAPQLKGKSIEVGWNNEQLPPLRSGSVIINGDIDGDGKADITISNKVGQDASKYFVFGFRILSSGNTLHALRLTDFSYGVVLGAESENSTFLDNIVSNLVMENICRDGITLHSGKGALDVWDSNNHWRGILIAGNTIEAKSCGIQVLLHYTAGNTAEGITIAHNTIRISQEQDYASFGISLGAGDWENCDKNEITDALIAYNRIEGNFDVGILLGSGGQGSGSNEIKNVQVVGNWISATNPVWEYCSGMAGVSLITGDGATDDADPSHLPVTYPMNNRITDVWIVGNTVEGIAMNGVAIGGGSWGATQNNIDHIYIMANVIHAIVAETGWGVSGINVNGGGGTGGSRNTFGNQISDIIISANTIQIEMGDKEPSFVQYASGGILIEGGTYTADHNRVSNIWITNNAVKSIVPGIHVMGGRYYSAGNTVSHVEVWCNVVSQSPEFTNLSFPEVKGVNLTGAIGDASDNIVEGVNLVSNLVAGRTNDLSVISNVLGSASGNVVNYSVNPSP